MVGYNFYEALVAHYESQKKEALATLKLCITTPVAVGDHSNLLGDMKMWTQKLAEAEDCLRVLQEYFVVQENKPVISE